MQGLHLTGDLFDCACSASVLTDLDTLSKLCREATLAAGLTIVDEKYHVFPEWQGQPGGITGAVLLAESHLAIHTWPEHRYAAVDLFTCGETLDQDRCLAYLREKLRCERISVVRIARGDMLSIMGGGGPR